MTYVWLRAVSFFFGGWENRGGGGGVDAGSHQHFFPGALFLPGHVSDGFPARFHVAALAGPGTGGTFSVAWESRAVGGRGGTHTLVHVSVCLTFNYICLQVKKLTVCVCLTLPHILRVG